MQAFLQQVAPTMLNALSANSEAGAAGRPFSLHQSKQQVRMWHGLCAMPL
jgi:hypothetical protein